jgi:hypothetical protein
MRPQNDAGAFRSIALINYANLLIQAGQLSYVTQNLYVDENAFRLNPFFCLFFRLCCNAFPSLRDLWLTPCSCTTPTSASLASSAIWCRRPLLRPAATPPPPTPPRSHAAAPYSAPQPRRHPLLRLLLRPLLRPLATRVTAAQDYIVNHWSDDSGDPWEEIKAQVFFVKHTYRHACILGSQLALFFKDADFAATLNATARAIEANINSVHWSDSKGYVMEIPAQRELDSAVHLAFLYGDSGDGFYTPGR